MTPLEEVATQRPSHQRRKAKRITYLLDLKAVAFKQSKPRKQADLVALQAWLPSRKQKPLRTRISRSFPLKLIIHQPVEP